MLICCYQKMGVNDLLFWFFLTMYRSFAATKRWCKLTKERTGKVMITQGENGEETRLIKTNMASYRLEC